MYPQFNVFRNGETREGRQGGQGGQGGVMSNE
jgi:hypothetical protein